MWCRLEVDCRKTSAGSGQDCEVDGDDGRE